MKRCPQCAREYDNTMSFCLDDGAELLYGPASMDEPTTAILDSTAAIDEAPTRAQFHTTDQTGLATGIEDGAINPRGFDKRLIIFPTLVIIAAVGFFGYRYFASPTSQRINSIAVLPFQNTNSDADYLSDGLTDSLIYRFSQLPNLKVSPTSSVMRHKGSAADVSQIANDLDVDAVLSGRLTQIGDDLSISVQLIEARTKKLIWAEQYDRKMTDLLATQREIAREIVEKLKLKVSGEEKGLAKHYTESNEAYQSYLKGRFYWNKRTGTGMQKALEY